MTSNQEFSNMDNHQSDANNSSVNYSTTIILDGGMGRELERRGAPFRQPEWSALALSADPDSVRATHLDYIKAGASIITTNSYAVTPFHLGERFFSEGAQLIETAAKLAFEAVQESKNLANTTLVPVQIAGCLPPLFGSYRPDLFDPKRAPDIAKPFLEAQAIYVDIWLAETQSSILEATTWHELITEFTDTQNDVDSKPIWMAFTLADSEWDILDGTRDATLASAAPTLRSGESVQDAVQAMITLGVEAILFNCSQPEVMDAALRAAKAAIEQAAISQQLQYEPKLGVYANAFASKQVHKQANARLRGMRDDTTPENYLQWATQWQDSGADIIGGCCGIGVEHIAKLARHIAAN